MTRTNRRLTTSGKDREDMKFPLLSIFVEPASRKDHGGGNPELVNILAFVFAAFMVFGNSLESHAASIMRKVVFAYATTNARIAPYWIAQEKGFFTKYGVEADLLFVRNTPIIIAGMVSGGIQIVNTSGLSALAAAAAGVDLKAVAAFSSRTMIDLFVRPGIESPKDLRGRRFGVQSFGGTNWMNGMLGLEQIGLDPDRDKISILVIGDQTILSQSLEGGTIDAMVITDRLLSRRLKQKGFPVLTELTLPVPGQVILVKTAYLKHYSETMEDVLKASIEGVAFVLTPSNKLAVLNSLMKHLRISDPTIVEEGYQDLVKHIDRKPYPFIEGLQNIQRLMKTHYPKLAEIRVEGLIESRFIRKLDESGFIDRLYKSYGVK